MVYRRDGRRAYTFQARTRTGFEQMGAGTEDKALATKIEHMWNDDLAGKERAWDVLEKVRPLRKKLEPGTVTVVQLYDLWIESKRNIAALRRRLADVDLEPLVAQWNTWLKSQKGADWAAHALVHVRRILPDGVPLYASSVTDTWLTTELAKIPLKRNTVRKIHSSWSSFFGYCTTVEKAFDVNPMSRVVRGEREKRPPVFYNQEAAERIVAWQPTEKRRAFFALVYGTGADVTPATLLEKDAINPVTHEVRVAGTKSGARDRIVRMADWAWPAFWSYASTVLHGRIFDGFDRWMMSDWHRQTVGVGVKDTHGIVTHAGLELSRRLPLRMARHHFAVRLLQAGAPVRVAAEQLGSDEKTVLDYYGPWITDAGDRAKWEKVATKQEAQRRKAK